MREALATVRLVTPCISSGADLRAAEIRSQSLRGALHYWFRALGGSRDREQRIFGRIGGDNEVRRSALTVRAVPPKNLRTSQKDGRDLTGTDDDYFLWPIRDVRNLPGSGTRGVVEAGEKFELRLAHVRTRGACPLPEQTLKAFLLLGAVGTRSRRCYGSLWPEKVTIDGAEWQVPQNGDSFAATLAELLTGSRISAAAWGSHSSWEDAVKGARKIFKSYRCGSEQNGTPSKWGLNDHYLPPGQGGPEVYRPVFGLPLRQRYSGGRETRNTRIWENGRWTDRWASPLLLKIVPMGGRFRVLALFMEDEVPAEGTRMELKDRQGRKDAVLSHELWRELKKEGRMIYSGAGGAERGGWSTEGGPGWNGSRKAIGTNWDNPPSAC